MTELATKITEIAESIKGFREDYGTRLSELERRAAREPANDNYSATYGGPSLGEMVIASDEVKRLSSDFRGKARLN